MGGSGGESVWWGGRLSREWGTTFEVSPLLMSRCFPGADDTADVFVADHGDDEQDVRLKQADTLNPVLAIVEAVIEEFNFSRIVQSTGSCREADTVLGAIAGCRGLLPPVFHVSNSTRYR